MLTQILITPELKLPWLEASILLPLLGSVLCGLAVNQKDSQKIAILFSGLTLLFTIGEWYDFSLLNTFQAHDNGDFIRWILGRDVFVIDELNAPLLPLAALLYLLTVLSTLPTKLGRFSFGMTLFSQSVTLATLSCHHPWVIILMLTIACVPPWVELRRRGASTRVFTLHMGLSTVLLVTGFSMVDPDAGPQSAPLMATALITMAVLLRAGVAPVHLWMPDLFEHASFGTAVLFVTPMTGAYAVMHLVLPYAPSWALQSIAVLSLFTSVYAAGMATVQTESRRFFCYLFLSNASLVLAGLEIVTTVGLTGALCVWFSVGISLSGFALTLRSVEARIGRISLDRYHGVYEHTPTLAGLFLLTGLASIGFPGTIGFIGMELLIEGEVGVYPVVGLAVVAAATLNGIAIMRAYFLIFTGRRFRTAAVLRSSPAERFAVVLLSLLIMGGGLWPQPGVSSRYHAAESLMRIRNKSEREAELAKNAEERVEAAPPVDAAPFD